MWAKAHIRSKSCSIALEMTNKLQKQTFLVPAWLVLFAPMICSDRNHSSGISFTPKILHSLQFFIYGWKYAGWKAKSQCIWQFKKNVYKDIFSWKIASTAQTVLRASNRKVHSSNLVNSIGVKKRERPGPFCCAPRLLPGAQFFAPRASCAPATLPTLVMAGRRRSMHAGGTSPV